MSKIARVFHLNKEIQKIYKNGVLQKLFFDWKKYIGEEINIEYARGYCSNRININGKVYQNLASKLYIGAGNTLMPTETKALEPNGYTHIKLPYPLKPNTSYTIVIDVEQPSEEHAFQLRNAKMEYLTLTIPTLTNKLVKGMNVATFTTSSNEISAILIKNAQNSTKDLIIKNNVIVIESDLSGETIIEENIKYLEEGTFKPENRIIEGKTYQNLLTNKIDYTFSGSAFYYNKTTLNNGAIYTRNNKEITSEVHGTYITLKCHKVASMLKSNTTYTLAFNIESTFSDYKGITVSGENDCYFKSSTSESNGTRYFHNESFDLSTGYKKIMFETNSNITQYFGFGFPLMQSQSEGTYLKITNIILLEGDYTHIDLPNSINGIESVGKREFVKSKNLYNKKFMNSAITAQGQFVDSRGFIFTINDECTFKINGTNTTGCTIMSENILDLLEDGKSYILSTNLLHFLAIITYKDDTPPKYTSAFTVNKSVMNTIKLYNQWPDTEIVTYDNFVVKNQIEEGTTATEYEPFYEYYPVTIRNYNYKCETDNIILPNGVKNSIDTIDGKKVHVQRVWKRVFDGSDDEKWRNGYGNGDGKNNRFEMEINSGGSYSNTYMNLNIVASVCSHFEYEITNSIPKSFGHYRIAFSNSEGKIFLLFNIDTNIVPLEDISAWKTWLSENPVTVWYELATPIYTYLESGIYDDITIPTSGIKNEIYSENGKWYHKRNIGKVIFDGSSDENWNYYNKDSIQRFDIKMPNEAKMYNVRTPVYTEGYQFEASKNEDKIIFISGVETVNKLYIYNYAYTSVEDFRAYLAKNPLEVYYELAEPVISELYFSDITYKLNEPLRSLPNGTCDTIEGNKLVQRVRRVMFDGNENWIFQSCDTNGNGILNIYFIIQDLKLKEKQFIICDKYIQQNTAIANTTKEGILVNEEKRLYLRLFTSKATTVEEAKEYIKDNPFVVYYELATPIETEITPDKIPPFLLKEGLTTLKSTNNITPQIELDCLVRDEFQNMCPNTWVNGDIAVDSGVEYSSSTSRIKLQDYIAVQPNTTYYCDTFSETVYSTAGKIGVRYYKNDKTYISGGGIGVTKTSYNKFTTPEDCYYIKFIVETLDTNYKMYLRPVK
jgi:hypothetical protein